ncbi:hypothetical protein IFM89_001343 [Coptis chinensis]|uniref:Deoxyhypusine hydroxylase n=1 Tax=Coptis chinensis TaxID=261450 RepID=A0A835HBU1_9MAGN|nr:hypothetical protein IFM89_001343 [Coptis chinensis]
MLWKAITATVELDSTQEVSSNPCVMLSQILEQCLETKEEITKKKMVLAKIFESSPETEKFLCERLLDQTQPLLERFRALFSLHNLRGSRLREALILATRDSSNLLAHEAAFALSQMQDAEAVPALEKVLHDLSFHTIVCHETAEALGAIGLEGNIPLLEKTLVSDPAQKASFKIKLPLLPFLEYLKNVSEHPMVRHEAAEALGSIADSQSVKLLEEFAKDVEPIVSQSCEVALSMLEFERSGKSFEYHFMQTPRVQ